MTNPNDDLLPEDVVWAAGGHASDVSLTAIADGQLAILPPLVLAHVHACATCTTHLGNAALLSLHTGREMTIAANAPRAALGEAHGEAPAHGAAEGRAPVPRLPVFLGLVVAFLGLLPTLLDAPAELGGATTFATRTMPMFANGLGTLGRRLLEPGSTVGLVLTYGAAALLLLMAFALVRLLPKKEVSR